MASANLCIPGYGIIVAADLNKIGCVLRRQHPLSEFPFRLSISAPAPLALIYWRDKCDRCSPARSEAVTIKLSILTLVFALSTTIVEARYELPGDHGEGVRDVRAACEGGYDESAFCHLAAMRYQWRELRNWPKDASF